MIPPEEVQEPVRDEHRDLRGGVALRGARLALRRGDAHDHVAQESRRKPGVEAPEIPFPHGKGEYIGRLVFPPVFFVENADLGVVRKDERQLRVLQLKEREHRLRAAKRERPQATLTDAARDPEADRQGYLAFSAAFLLSARNFSSPMSVRGCL